MLERHTFSPVSWVARGIAFQRLIKRRQLASSVAVSINEARVVLDTKHKQNVTVHYITVINVFNEKLQSHYRSQTQSKR